MRDKGSFNLVIVLVVFVATAASFIFLGSTVGFSRLNSHLFGLPHLADVNFRTDEKSPSFPVGL